MHELQIVERISSVQSNLLFLACITCILVIPKMHNAFISRISNSQIFRYVEQVKARAMIEWFKALGLVRRSYAAVTATTICAVTIEIRYLSSSIVCIQEFT